jgi:hypothetical protein
LSEYTQQTTKKTADEKAKQINKERELEKKSIEAKTIPEQAPPPEEPKKINVPVTTR